MFHDRLAGLIDLANATKDQGSAPLGVCDGRLGGRKLPGEWRVTVKAASVGDVRFKTVMNSDQLGSRPVEETEATTFYK